MGASEMTVNHPLLDTYGRAHTNLRISVTDRCNIRCFYCMPNENVKFRPRSELLTYEEIETFVGIVAPMGVEKIRLTGGEPLVRTDLTNLIERLSGVAGIHEIALTTNGVLLGKVAQSLRDAGLNRLNISIDGLSESTFQKITRRSGIDKVLDGIAAAQAAGFEKIRLNAVVMPGVNEHEIAPLARFARERSLELRFIEFMPLDAEGNWQADEVITGDQIKRTIEGEVGALEPVSRLDASQPAVDFQYVDQSARVGFINSVTQPFCNACNRLRITAEGKLRNCLFSLVEWDIREPLRSGASRETIEQRIRECVLAKKAGHGIDSDSFQKPDRAMYQIGG